MEEIGNNIYIEAGYPGVVLAAFNFNHGLVMIDSPFRSQDLRSWRASLINLGGGVDKVLVMMDTHIDRTLGIKAMESSVIGHEQSEQILKGRPTAARSQEMNAGADWEPFDLPSSIRWVIPNMFYTDSLSIYWDEEPIVLSHHPGAHIAATWVRYDAQKIVFVGDSVVINQPPFLAWSDIDVWLQELEWLQSESFVDYQIISGRNGLVQQSSIHQLTEFLQTVQSTLEDLAEKGGGIDDAVELAPKFLEMLNINRMYLDLYENRMVWGLKQYYEQHFLMAENIDQEER